MSDDATKDIADVKRYIRTYAGDLAKASGAAAPDGTKTPSYVPQKVTPPEPAKKPEPVSATAAKGTIDLESFAAPAAAVSQFKPAPSAPTPVPDQSREEVLNRLRARVATYQKPEPAPQPTELTPRPLGEAVSVPSTTKEQGVDPFREPLPPPVPPVRVAQVPVAPPPPPKPEPSAKEVPDTGHTFSSDFKQHAARTGSSTFSVLAAEANKEKREAPKPLTTKKPDIIVPALMGLLALSLAGAGVYGVYALLTNQESVPVVNEPSALIFADEETTLTGPDYFGELARLSQEALPEGTVLVTKAGGESLAAALLKEAPDLLLRNISPESTVGIIDVDAETKPFFALKIGSYERTFAGMLAFEPELLDTLGTLYPAYPEEVVSPEVTDTATTTETAATTSPQVAEPAPLPAPTTFTDAVVANHDVRVLRDGRGKSLVLYGYAGKDLLIIARDEFAFVELLSRVRP